MSRTTRSHVRLAALATSACGLFFTGAPLLAQEGGGGLRPVDEAPPRDVGGWVEEGPEPTTDAQGADPLAPAPAPEGEAVGGQGGEELSPEERRKRDRRINRNYDAALDIYEDLNRPHHDMRALDRRIANNERIVKEYSERIGRASEERRNLQVELYNRTFYLKQQLERGQIDQETFDRLVEDEEMKYRERSERLKSDLAGWQREVDEARARLDNLRGERRMLEAAMPRSRRRGKKGGEEEPKLSPAQRLVGSLEERLRRLQGYRLRTPLDSVHPRDVGVSSVGQRPALGGLEADLPADEGE